MATIRGIAASKRPGITIKIAGTFFLTPNAYNSNLTAKKAPNTAIIGDPKGRIKKNKQNMAFTI
jgi:hypothetical protein